MPGRSTLRILLLQARNPDDGARVEERASFARFCEVEVEQVTPWDLLEGPPPADRLVDHDAVMIGGSGDYYVSKRNLPHYEATLGCLAEIATAGPPLFASCFGFQLLTAALGGEIVHDPETTEVGTYELSLTGAGSRDELFGELPERFAAQLGRKDRATRLPAEAAHLASSERCPFQAFRMPNRPVWATQFHPELDETTNRERFLRYLDGYAAYMSDAEREEALRGFTESPATASLLRRFLDVAV